MKGSVKQTVQIGSVKVTKSVVDYVDEGLVRTTQTATCKSNGRTLLFQRVTLQDGDKPAKVFYKRYQDFGGKKFYVRDFFFWIMLGFYTSVNLDNYAEK